MLLFKRLKPKVISVFFISTVILASTVLLFDWNWFRPALERYISYKSDRVVKADDLQIEFDGFLQPTIKLRNLYIQNAAWSSKRPLISVKEISFSFATFGMLFSDKRVIIEISMSDGEVNLERLSDGLRNWRLLEPSYRGPGKYIVMSLKPNLSTIRFTDRKNMLNMVAQSSAIAKTPVMIKKYKTFGSEVFTKQINFQGTYHGSKFIGLAVTGETITFQKTGKKFSIVGDIKADEMAMLIDGEIGDIFRDQLIDADIIFSTPSIAILNPFLNTHFPHSHAIKAQAHLKKEANEYFADHLHGKIGTTDINGEITYINNKNQPLLNGSLSSKEAYLADLILTKSQKEDKKSDKKIAHSIWPLSKIPTEMLKSHDVNLTLNVDKLIAYQLPQIENVYAKIDLKNGNLNLTPIKATLFGSPIRANLTLSTQVQPMPVKMVVNAQNLALNKLIENTSLRNTISAPLTAHIDIYGTGSSIQNLLANVSGKMDFTVGKGEISNKLDAKMGLDAGKLVWLTIKGDKKIGINSGAMKIDFKNGIGQSQKLVIDTAQTHIQGKGNINLNNETLDFLLTPEPKDPTIFSVESNIHIHGAINKPEFELVRKLTDKTAPSRHKDIAQQNPYGLK